MSSPSSSSSNVKYILPTLYQQFIYTSRYSRFLWSEKRRETWDETVERYLNFFKKQLKTKIKANDPVWEELSDAIGKLEVMPSMRALMTAGEALERDHVSGYNCSYLAIDNPRAFDEILYILMCGTGVGFSVEQKYVDQLPSIAEDFHPTETTIIVSDSKLGWAKAFKELVHLLYGGQVPNIDTSKLRKAGEPLKTFGGRASGPEPFENLVRFTIKLFKNAAGRRLTTLEAHDLVCMIASCVVVGGVRRSALISLSDLFDDRMRDAKSGQWYVDQVQRALANNSYVVKGEMDIGVFMKEWLALYQSKSGERGIFSRTASQLKAAENGRREKDHDFGTNPCCLPGDVMLYTLEYGKISLKEVVNLYSKEKEITVLSHNISEDIPEYVMIEAAKATRPNAELIELEIETSEGIKTLKLTPDHKVYTKNRGYVRADELNENDDLVIHA